MRTPSLLIPLVFFVLAASGPGAAGVEPGPSSLLVDFSTNPIADPEVILDGDVLDRLTWHDDAPAFDGDVGGSLAARYDSSLPPGRIGWSLPETWTEDTPFVAAAVFVVDPEDFHADPDGFFQISWGLWNTAATGLNRTGSPEGPADTFELVEFDYFPNVSPEFGGPYLSPAVFGVANPEDPLFDAFGAFANAGFAFGFPLALPMGEPLVAGIEHRPAADAVVFTVHRILEGGELLPVDGAVRVVDLGFLAVREFAVDALGLTLYQEGFPGEEVDLRADVIFHAVGARPGEGVSPDEVRDVVPLGR